MAVTMYSPPHSFVRFSDQHLSDNDWSDDSLGDLGFCLPWNNGTDLKFQIIFETDTEAEADTIEAWDPAKILMGTYSGSPNTTPPASSLDFITLSGVFTKSMERATDTIVILHVTEFSSNVTDDYTCGQCFQFMIGLQGGGTSITYGAKSNCFVKACDTTFTSLLEYEGYQNEADFYYCFRDDEARAPNKVRLPLYLTQPVYPAEEAVYRDSKGYISRTKANVGKQYIVKTDWMPDWAHQCVVAALIHDYQHVTSKKYTGEFSKNGDYSPEYEDFLNYPLAPVEFKVDASPFLIKNNNCGCPAVFVITPFGYNGALTTATLYTKDLTEIVASDCEPLVFTIFSYDSTFIQSPGPVITGNILTFTTKNPLPGVGTQTMIVFKVSCEGTTKNISIAGST